MRISDWSSDVCSSDLGAYRERCSGDARRAVRLLSRVKIGISVSAPPILSRICGALCCCITLSCRRHSLPIQEMPRQIDGTEIAQVHSCELIFPASEIFAGTPGKKMAA